MTMLDLTGRVVVKTGGTENLGYDIADILAADGGNIIITSNNDQTSEGQPGAAFGPTPPVKQILRYSRLARLGWPVAVMRAGTLLFALHAFPRSLVCLHLLFESNCIPPTRNKPIPPCTPQWRRLDFRGYIGPTTGFGTIFQVLSTAWLRVARSKQSGISCKLRW